MKELVKPDGDVVGLGPATERNGTEGGGGGGGLHRLSWTTEVDDFWRLSDDTSPVLARASHESRRIDDGLAAVGDETAGQ